MTAKPKTPVPSESAEQIALFRWVWFMSKSRPELSLLHHIGNGGWRNPATAARLKREGVRAGVPDLCLPVARGGFHSLYVELKRKTGGKVSDVQKTWIAALQEQGHLVAVCAGADEAIKVITGYLNLKQ